jgi:hypothetical protein
VRKREWREEEGVRGNGVGHVSVPISEKESTQKHSKRAKCGGRYGEATRKKSKKKNQVVAGMGEKVKRNTSSRVVNIPQ